MTHVHITNSSNASQATKYYIEIEVTNLDFDYQNNPANTLEYPKEPGEFGQPSQTYFIDLQKRAIACTIKGRIDIYANRTSLWAASAVHDVGVVRKRLQYMFDLGGTLTLIIGKGDNYYNVADTATEEETWTGQILKMNFAEEAADHVNRTTGDENYPPATLAKVAAYEVTIEFRKGDLIPL